MTLQQRWIQDDILDWYDRFAADLDEVINRLESELVRRKKIGAS